jgi:hypothetical protein
LVAFLNALKSGNGASTPSSTGNALSVTA